MAIPTSTLLFPDFMADDSTRIVPVAGGYVATPRQGRVIIEFENGAEQKRKAHDVLMDFKYQTVPMTPALARGFASFMMTVGHGDVNFTFYEPEAIYYEELLIGITDGTSSLVLGWRGLDSWGSLEVDGSSVDYAIANESEATKEDRIDFLTVDPPPGQEIIMTNVYARRRYVCAMDTWRAYAHKGGAAGAELFQPAFASVPVFRRVWDLTFHEIGGY